MALKEHDNNIITKEQNDPVIIYLRNIIQRYFQIENDISQESKEAIIIQAYTRLKEFLNAFSNQYMICINERSGAIDLTIRDFDGEETFDKNSAFNKDFCNVTTETKTLWDGTDETYNNFGEEQADHIVAGDDDRLCDARIPLAHLHKIDEINGLRELLDGYRLISNSFHLHNNLKFLNMIIYTGTMVSIDLALIEDLTAKVNASVNKFKETNIYFNTTAQHYLNQLHEIFNPIYNKLENIDNNIDDWISEWFNDSKIYADLKEGGLRNYIIEIAKQYLSVQEFDTLKDTLEKSVRIIDDQEFDVSSANFANPVVDSVNTKNIPSNYHDTTFNIKEGYTKIALDTEVSDTVSDTTLDKIYNNNILNTVQKFFLEYTEDGVTYCDQLPHVYQVNNSRHDFILAYANVDENNKVNACFKRLSYLPVYLYYPMKLFSWVEDNTGRVNSSFLHIDNTNTTNVNNGKTQVVNTMVTDDSDTISFKMKRTCIPVATQHIRDLQTLVANYDSTSEGPVPGIQGRFGAYKELLIFTAKENYTGDFTLTMNTGHWYGFAIWESSDNTNFTEVINNYLDTNAKHTDEPLTLSISNITFTADKTYKIVTQECSGGGTSSDNFIYTFETDADFTVSVAEEVEIDVDVTVNVHKDVDFGRINWTVTRTYDSSIWTIVGDDPSFVYKIIKNNNREIDCGTNTSYVDTPLDTLLPLQPTITGRCISSTGSEDTYEFIIDASDQQQSVSYKLQVYANETDISNTGLMGTSNDMTISANSGIRKIHYSTMINSFVDFSDNSTFTLVSDTDLSATSKKIVIKRDNSFPFNDKFIFCDNSYEDTSDKLTKYLNDFNAHLCVADSLNIDYLKDIALMQESEAPFYHVGNEAEGGSAYFNGNVFIMNDVTCSYYGEFNYGTLNDFFPNAKIRYQIILIPGKGEDDA